MTEKKKTLDFCLDWIKTIRQDMDQLNEDRAEAIKYYFAKELGNEIEGRSKVTTSDLADTVEWVLPNLMRIFASGDEVVSISPTTPDDTEGVKLHQELANYQLRVRNKWYVTLNDFFRDALLLKIGVLKYRWVREKETVEKAYQGLTQPELIALLQDPDVEVLETETVGDPLQGEVRYDVVIQKTIIDEYPHIEAVPPEEVGFPKDAKDIDTVPFFYHRVLLAEWEIKQNYGEEAWDKLKGKLDELEDSQKDGGIIDDDTWNSRFEDLGGIEFWRDEKAKKFWIYECYYRDNSTGKPQTFVFCGDVPLAERDNEYGRPPFRIGPPVRLAHRMVGRSLHDMLKQLMELRTVLIRQILDNVYFSNLGRYVGDENRVNLNDFLNNNHPGAFIRGDPNAIKELLPPQLQPWTFKLLEYVETEKEARTGVTKYNQGLDSNSLNKTARGIYAILNQSQQRTEMMARLFAEMVIGPLAKDVIDMNIKFLSKKTAIRVLNEWKEINPDNVVGKFDVIVDVGIGTGAKDQVIAQMQQLLGLYAQMVKMGVPIANADTAYNAMKELVKAMGYRNYQDFIAEPETAKKVMNLVQMVSQFAQQMGIQDPQIQKAIMEVAALFGGPGQGGPKQGGTQEGQETPNLPQEPAQPLPPVTTPVGRGFYG